MAQPSHSFGPTCVFHEDETIPLTVDDINPPMVKAQFFYVSLLPIDDPLSPVPTVQTDKLTNTLPQPFSIRDNAALEETWRNIQRQQQEKKINGGRPASRGLTRMTSFPAFQSSLKSPYDTSPTAESSAQGMLASKPNRKHSSTSTSLQMTKEENGTDTTRRAAPRYPRRASIRSSASRSRKVSQSCTDHYPTGVDGAEEMVEDKGSDDTVLPVLDSNVGTLQRKQSSPVRQRRRTERGSPQSSMSLDNSQNNVVDNTNTTVQPFTPTDSNISGRPFARAPSSRQITTSKTSDSPEPKTPTSISSQQDDEHIQQRKRNEDSNLIPVGISRLHLVQLPEMQMKPIYWSPINDVSNVIRATWFYKETMLPVSAEVANRLEAGYEDMRPWATTYQDELDACIEHGAAAEMKVVHKLWAEDSKSSRPPTAVTDKNAGDESDEEADDQAVLPKVLLNAASDPRTTKKKRRLFESHSVVYVNARDAQILRPNALPSVSRNRKPLHSIRKGRQLGVAVVRGFDRHAWKKLHPDLKQDAKAVQAKVGAILAQSGSDATSDQRQGCARCEDEAAKPRASDLVLVIHGIGQKLSERVDSYHFTHAINGLRREFNVELANETVRGSLRNGAGVMVLPVNWRLTVNFDDEHRSAENQYGLSDVTPESLPAVRSLISDVMLDIPYYMSHHKKKMTAAVIKEANRIYRLWCQNNPGFEDYGRVHIVAHSLGSVMAMEILSNQPTFVPEHIDLSGSAGSESMFEFNTTNLFCCGSPASFFLLLNGGNLVPRRGRNKAGMEGEDSARGVSGDQGQYGCLAVDNIYNICHRNDPIAYCQNACVDRDYAASLQPASIPSVSQSLFGRIGNSLRWASSTAQDAYGFVPTAARPNMFHMPSTVELETHNFTREEIAEKRMSLLNDNGQIDYYLSSGGGPLEIQYLNMLSAHSSYWVLQDFVRFLVVEIGRTPGKAHTLPALRAAKKREYKRGTLV